MNEKVDILQKEVEILIRKNESLKDEILLLQQQCERLKGQLDIYRAIMEDGK